MDKDKRHRTHFSLGQAMALAAICSSTAAVLTAMVAVSFFANSSTDYYSDRLIASTSRSIISRTRFRPITSTEMDPAQRKETSSHSGKDFSTESTFPLSVLPSRNLEEEGPRPHIVWLMSFPNSGTSFTLHMTREASNCTTATNYALEGDIKDKPSVPAIAGPAGENGPFLELIPNRDTNIPESILTKTHCKGFCSGEICGPERTLHTVRSFMMGCLSGKRAVETENGLEKIDVTYDKSLVKKAIHLFRHPLDNIVARFHLEYKVQGERGNTAFVETLPRNSTGFHRWCAMDDRNRELIESRFMDVQLKAKMRVIPCMNDFYRYVQWHNLAFAVSRDMNIPTMLLHYHEYSDDFESTRDRVLHWIGLPHVGQGEPFHAGKVYRHYYSAPQKIAIREFLEEVASAETWEQIKIYDFSSENITDETATE
ncbi:hypothetical protein ACA910_001700 [Epithemia clementina (nom. ined.)]